MSNCIFPNTTRNDIINFVEYTIPQMIAKKVNIDKYKESYKKYNKYDMLYEKASEILIISYLIIAIIALFVANDSDEMTFIINLIPYFICITVLTIIYFILKIYFRCQYNKYHRYCLNIKLPIIKLFKDKLYIMDSESVFTSLLEPEGYNANSNTITGFESIFIINRIKDIIKSCNNSDTIMFRIHENDTITLNISMDDNKNIYFDVLVNDISYKQYTIDGPTCIEEFNKLTKNIKSTNTYDFTYLDDRFNEYHKMACDALEKLEIKE